MTFEGETNRSAVPGETELKLAVRADDLRRLGRLPVFQGMPVTRRLLTSTYYDTPDLALKHRSLALRVRRIGGRFVQTLKSGGPALRRAEWEAPLPHGVPDPTLPDIREQLADLDGASLKPVFTSRIRRAARLVQADADTVVEVSFDHGVLETPSGAELAIAEIELELKAGKVEGLFELARILNGAGALRLETRSKSARGYALLAEPAEGQAPQPQRFGGVVLTPDMPAEEALAAIVRRALHQMLANEPAVLAEHVEGVHQMRVALRRLRTTLSLFKNLIPEAQRHWINTEIKRWAESLGTARNWDIFAALVRPLAEAFPGDPDVEALCRAMAGEREAAYRALVQTVGSGDFTDFALRLTQWVETRAWRQQMVSASSVQLFAPLRSVADQLIDQRYRVVRKRAKHFDQLDPQQRHRVRIALKKLRYAVDSFASLYDAKAVARRTKELSSLQDDLGDLNDLATAQDLTRKLQARQGAEVDLRLGAAILQGWSGRMAAEMEGRLRRKLKRLRRMKPFRDAADKA